MRWLVLLMVGGCIVHDKAETLTRWKLWSSSSADIGCVSASANVRKTGKDGVGVSLQLKSHGDCDVAIGNSTLSFENEGGQLVVNHGGTYALKGNSLIYVWLPMLFDADEIHPERAVIYVAITSAGTTGALRVSLEQVPGDAVGVTDLGEPMKFENGDPQKFVLAAEPDWWALNLWVMPYFLWGHGREHASIASRETGVDLHFEGARNRYTDEGSWGITATVPFAQYGPGRGTDALGALGLEFDYRWTFFDAGVGPALYTERSEMGVQASIRFPFGMLRMRYMATSGIEVLAGFQLPFPMVYARSK